MNEDRRREIGLFRYALVRDAADPGLSKAERGRLVRALADREHLGPDGRLVGSRAATLDEWIRAYRRGGFEALFPGRAWSRRARRPNCSSSRSRSSGSGRSGPRRRSARSCSPPPASSRCRGCGRCRRIRPPGAQRPRGRPLAREGLWPLRGLGAQRAVDRGRGAPRGALEPCGDERTPRPVRRSGLEQAGGSLAVGTDGEGGKQPRQRRDGPVLPDGSGPASKTGRCT